MVIKNEHGKVETDIYYKKINNHEYLNYNSHHPTHIKNNIPFNLAKRIIVFCFNPERTSHLSPPLQTMIVSIINNRLTTSKNDRIENTFSNINTVLALRQPKNFIRHLTTAK